MAYDYEMAENSSIHGNVATSFTSFEMRPAEAPTCYVVGFTSTYSHNSLGDQRTYYKETEIPVADVTDQSNKSDIVERAWLSIKDDVSAWAKSMVLKTPQAIIATEGLDASA